MAFYELMSHWCKIKCPIQLRLGKRIYAIIIVIGLVFMCSISFAGEVTGKYQVVAGSDENAYLVDTATGAVWVLTYRTMATGREPIAIPYNFIGISPKNQDAFLVEIKTGASMPPGKTK